MLLLLLLYLSTLRRWVHDLRCVRGCLWYSGSCVVQCGVIQHEFKYLGACYSSSQR